MSWWHSKRQLVIKAEQDSHFYLRLLNIIHPQPIGVKHEVIANRGLISYEKNPLSPFSSVRNISCLKARQTQFFISSLISTGPTSSKMKLFQLVSSVLVIVLALDKANGKKTILCNPKTFVSIYYWMKNILFYWVMLS